MKRLSVLSGLLHRIGYNEKATHARQKKDRFVAVSGTSLRKTLDSHPR
jgi:hypothetical protein